MLQDRWLKDSACQEWVLKDKLDKHYTRCMASEIQLIFRVPYCCDGPYKIWYRSLQVLIRSLFGSSPSPWEPCWIGGSRVKTSKQRGVHWERFALVASIDSDGYWIGEGRVKNLKQRRLHWWRHTVNTWKQRRLHWWRHTVKTWKRRRLRWRAHGQNLETETSALEGTRSKLGNGEVFTGGGTRSKLGHREVCTCWGHTVKTWTQRGLHWEWCALVASIDSDEYWTRGGRIREQSKLGNREVCTESGVR